MVLVHFTYLAQQALIASDRVARNFGSSQVQSDHLLFAMLMYRECTAAKIMAALGLRPSDLGELHRVAEDAPRVRRDRSGFSRETKRILRKAAREGGGEAVGTTVVLAALLEEGTGPAVRALSERGVTAEAVRAEAARHPAAESSGLSGANPLPPALDVDAS